MLYDFATRDSHNPSVQDIFQFVNATAMLVIETIRDNRSTYMVLYCISETETACNSLLNWIRYETRYQLFASILGFCIGSKHLGFCIDFKLKPMAEEKEAEHVRMMQAGHVTVDLDATIRKEFKHVNVLEYSNRFGVSFVATSSGKKKTILLEMRPKTRRNWCIGDQNVGRIVYQV